MGLFGNKVNPEEKKRGDPVSNESAPSEAESTPPDTDRSSANENKNDDDSSSKGGRFSQFKESVAKKVGDGVDLLPEKWQIKIKALAQEAEELREKLNKEIEYQKEQIKVKVAQAVTVVLDKALVKVEAVAKEKLKDDDMPKVVKRAVDGAVENIMPDIREEVMETVQTSFRKLKAADEGEPFGCCPNPFRKFRAVVLYELFPYDRTIWQQLRSPLYWLLMIPPAFPRYGVSQLWFILMLIMRDKSDEFQLINYILGFKGFQFFSVGVFPAIFGSFQLYFCAVKDSPDCHLGKNPSLDYWELAFFCLQVILMWGAFICLPFSKKKGGPVFVHPLPSEMDPPPNKFCGMEVYKRRGGRLGRWVFYDTFTFFLAAGLIAWAAFASAGAIIAKDAVVRKSHEWELKTTFFFCKVIYGLLSFPWLLFQMPLAKQLFTHAKPTAYNKNGKTLPLSKKVKKSAASKVAQEVTSG